MEKQINLIAFLSKVVSRNTQNYRKDFELDAQKLRDALTKSRQDERIFYFMSRPNGTWCVLERDAFLRGSDGYKIWTHYADMADGIEAYRVVITGQHGSVPMGYVVKLNFRDQVRRVIKAAMPVDAVELTFTPAIRFGFRWRNTGNNGKKSSLITEQSRASAAVPKAKRNCTV